MDGPSPQPALKGALLPGVLKKKKKIIQPKGREGKRGRNCPIYTQHCKHTRSILHVLQSGVCMSVCPSVSLGAGSQGPCPALTPPTPPCPTLGTESGTGMVPNLGGNQQAGLGLGLHSGSRAAHMCTCVCVCACMYTGNLCACMYRGEGHVTEAAGGAAGGKASWGVAHK